MKNPSTPTAEPLTFWTWQWISGGYNSVSVDVAPDRWDAIHHAVSMCPGTDGRKKLVPDLATFKQVTTKEMVAIDRSWSSMFD